MERQRTSWPMSRSGLRLQRSSSSVSYNPSTETDSRLQHVEMELVHQIKETESQKEEVAQREAVVHKLMCMYFARVRQSLSASGISIPDP